MNPWDLGVVGSAGGLLSPTNSILQSSTGVDVSGMGIQMLDPSVVSTLDIPLTFTSWRTNVNFVGAIMVTVDLPPNPLGDYHLQSGSPAINAGASTKTVPAYQRPPNNLAAPLFDFDNQVRPYGNGNPSTIYDIGADEWMP